MQTDPAPQPPDNAPSPAVGRFPIATAVAAFCALLLVVMIRDLAPGRTQRNEFVTSAAQLVFVITSAVLWWRVVVTRDRGRGNLAVALCLSGWALIAVRDVVAAGVGKTHLALPPPVDIAITYLSITCLIVFLIASLGRAQRKAAVIATVCLVLAGAGGFMLLHSRSAELSHGSKAGFALYSAMHLAGFALIARVALIKRNWTWALVLGGRAVLLAVDSSFAFLVSARPDGAVPVGASAGLLVCPLILVVAARCAMAETCPDPAPELSQSVPTRAKNVPSSEN